MITPLDIENKTFNKQLVNGYSTEEVHEFMTALLKDYEKIYKENIEYKDKIAVLNQGIQHYKSIEDTLQNALIVAQGTADSVKQNAKAEADNIVKEAEINAMKAVDDINQKAIEKQMQLDEAKKQFDIYKAKMESLLISQLEILKEINRDPIILKMKSTPANESDLQTAQDLLDTVTANSDRCVGMAANMIGVNKTILVALIAGKYKIMINPEITDHSVEYYETEEGCLSLNGVRPAKRYKKITVSWLDEKFRNRKGTFRDFEAQIIQHEIDHFSGILI